jgi:hypothetical protein
MIVELNCPLEAVLVDVVVHLGGKNWLEDKERRKEKNLRT